jgi:hypothetical protein
MRFLTRTFLGATLACLFAFGVFLTTPVSAFCGQWPHQCCSGANCKDADAAPDPGALEMAGMIWRGVRLVAGLAI